jgi:hypothetical protein
MNNTSLEEEAQAIKRSLLPQKSAGKYTHWAKFFSNWMKQRNLSTPPSEDILLVFFKELSRM